MIQVEGLTKYYGSRSAIEDLTFHADKGEIVGFLGPNGAGKTTTMRILTGYMPASAGKAIVAGYDVFTHSMAARKVTGYLPETVPLYDDLAVWQYLDFMAELRKMPNRDDRVEDVMEAVRIVDRAESLIGNLSKGLRQRVGLAQALLHEPDVLILDEPTIGLDPEQVRDVRELIRKLGRERTVMLSTHILSEAQTLCSRVLIINRGQIVAEDTPQQLQARLAGGDRIQVRVGGDGDGLADLLLPMEEVVRVNTVTDNVYELELAAGMNARADVARKIVNGGFDLLEFRSLDMSLEDIYLQLIASEAAMESMALAASRPDA